MSVNFDEAKQIVASGLASGLIKAAPEPLEKLPVYTEPKLAVASPTTIAPAVTDIQVTAETADEMTECQSALIVWCKNKVISIKAEATELKEAFEHAVKRKWKSDTLKRHAAIAAKRVGYYERMLTALEHGYQILPTIPMEIFAIRTTKENPPKGLKITTWSEDHIQESNSPDSGEGEYRNPFPIVKSHKITDPATGKDVKTRHWAEAWRDLEFPLSMAKPKIMEATTRAMALKIFDDLGIILPQTAKADPIIVARLKDPRPTGWYSTKYVSFIIAWHLDTRTL